MSSDRSGGRMASTARREILAFGAFVLALVTAVGIALIAKGGWDANQWAALAGLAAMIQAIVLVVGLAFAYQQVSVAREISERQRQRELVDRLVRTADTLAAQLRTCSTGLAHFAAIEDFMEQLETESPAGVQQWRATERERSLKLLFQQRDAAAVECRKLRRDLDMLGLDQVVLTLAVEFELLRYGSWTFSERGKQPPRTELDASADKLGGYAMQIDRLASHHIRMVAPRVPQVAASTD